MKNIVKKPELLSPAGNMACLEAALSAGCDAVYAGADRFGARAYAGNFTSEEFVQAIDRMHLFGKKVYLTLNTLIKPDEFRQLHDFVRPFYETGLDGVIVQD
ncbi:MAG: U32 family peptidase, partial [Lachnospiraceae bacterium]|nr:U32 family peptidase [Lachnospiraceae bacterium]